MLLQLMRQAGSLKQDVLCWVLSCLHDEHRLATAATK
tara:strand:+ start:127 stop:237 length:111 start_codon:yes stop_codon:yes gene_type:complete